MFGFLDSKTAAQRKSEAGVMASIQRAKNVWENADLNERMTLLKRVINIQDDRLFLAYIHSAWSQIPNDDQWKLIMEIMRREINDEIANRAGVIAAQSFSVERFNFLFGQKSFVDNWTRDDALGVWYCLGHFCFLISIASMIGLPEVEVGNVIEVGQKALMKTWKMSASTLKRFEEFNETKLASVYTIYKSISRGDEFGRFFTLFVSEIIGNDISFSLDAFSGGVIVQFLAGKMIDMDPFLHSKVGEMFAIVKDGVREQFRGFKA